MSRGNAKNGRLCTLYFYTIFRRDCTMPWALVVYSRCYRVSSEFALQTGIGNDIP